MTLALHSCLALSGNPSQLFFPTSLQLVLGLSSFLGDGSGRSGLPPYRCTCHQARTQRLSQSIQQLGSKSRMQSSHRLHPIRLTITIKLSKWIFSLPVIRIYPPASLPSQFISSSRCKACPSFCSSLARSTSSCLVCCHVSHYSHTPLSCYTILLPPILSADSSTFELMTAATLALKPKRERKSPAELNTLLPQQISP
jgi:hypothetical protein